MNDFVIYLIKSTIALALFALVYRFILREDVNFRVRRIYLLSGVFASLLLPFLSLQVNIQPLKLPSVLIDEITIYGNGFRFIRDSSAFTIIPYIFMIYILIVAFFALRIVFQVFRVRIKSRKHDSQDADGFRIYYLEENNISFSFFKDIFIGRTGNRDDMEKIIAHEKVHALQWHTVDIIFMELVTAVFWFNPLVWWYRTEIRNVHEYLADEGALAKGFNIKLYQITLLEHLIGSASLSITNHFNYSLIKNRIAMMNKNKNTSRNTWKLLLVIPLSLLLIFVYSCTEKNSSAMSDTETQAPKDEKVYYVVDQMPTFRGGDPATEFRKYLVNNLKFPKSAIENNITGKVFVQFVVSSSGKVTDVKVKKGADPALDAEALRVISSSPDWEPGKQDGKPVNVQFVFPINFALN